MTIYIYLMDGTVWRWTMESESYRSHASTYDILSFANTRIMNYFFQNQNKCGEETTSTQCATPTTLDSQLLGLVISVIVGHYLIKWTIFQFKLINFSLWTKIVCSVWMRRDTKKMSNAQNRQLDFALEQITIATVYANRVDEMNQTLSHGKKNCRTFWFRLSLLVVMR